MRITKTWMSVAALLMLAPSISAQTVPAPTYDRVLLPIMVRDVPGAFGSQWTSSTWVTNLASARKDFQAFEPCSGTLCSPVALNAGEARPVTFVEQPSGNPGIIAYVEAPSSDVFLQTLVRDMSQQADSAGTEVPAVREDEFRSDRIRLLRVPLDVRYRQMLRVYALDAVAGDRVRIRFLDELRREIAVSELELEVPPTATTRQNKPAYGQLSDFRARVAGLPSSGNVIVDLEPLNPSLRIWGFISITNNNAQHVTLITMR